MRSRGKKAITISRLLWQNYIVIIITSIALIVIPYAVLGLFAQIYSEDIPSYNYTASSIMQDSISDINLEGIIKNKGSVDVIQKDLSVIHLGGKETLGVKKFTMAELTDFFIDIKSNENDYHRDISFNNKEGFWVIVTFPISLKINIGIQYNKEAIGFNFFRMLVLTTLLGYAGIVFLSVILYSKYTARSFVKPMCILKDITVQIEKEDFQYVLQSNEEFTIKEFTQYKEALKHMSLELNKQRDLTQKELENRKSMVRDISHDLKNPLASIRGYSELYLNHQEISDEQKYTYVDSIYRNSIRANELITSLFEYSKIDSAEFKLQLSNVDICELIRNVAAEYIPKLEENNLIIQADIPEKEIFIRADSLQIRRVFCNLLDNAVKYQVNGTKIMIGLQVDEPSGMVKILVKDDGIGMKEEVLEHCFEPFSRGDRIRNSKTGGSGLGLAIVKRIIELHKGNITVTSRENEGCNFLIQLPLDRLN